MLSALESPAFSPRSVPLARVALGVAAVLAAWAALRLLGSLALGPDIAPAKPVVLEASAVASQPAA